MALEFYFKINDMFYNGKGSSQVQHGIYQLVLPGAPFSVEKFTVE